MRDSAGADKTSGEAPALVAGSPGRRSAHRSPSAFTSRGAHAIMISRAAAPRPPRRDQHPAPPASPVGGLPREGHRHPGAAAQLLILQRRAGKHCPCRTPHPCWSAALSTTVEALRSTATAAAMPHRPPTLARPSPRVHACTYRRRRTSAHCHRHAADVGQLTARSPEAHPADAAITPTQLIIRTNQANTLVHTWKVCLPMSEFLVSVLAKVGIALAEAIVARVVWELCTAYTRSHRAATA